MPMACSRRGASSGLPTGTLGRGSLPNTHPDHDTIATFRRTNKAAFEAAFLEVLLLAREMRILKLGPVSIKPALAKAGGGKIDANASKIRSVRGACPRAGPSTEVAAVWWTPTMLLREVSLWPR